MPSRKGKRRPRVADLSALLEALIKAEIDFIVVGGLAAVAQGAPITTMDMDIVPRQSNDNIEKLFACGSAFPPAMRVTARGTIKQRITCPALASHNQ